MSSTSTKKTSNEQTFPLVKTVASTPQSPVIASLLALVGFALLFAASVSPDQTWQWVCGGIAVLAAGLFAGFAGDVQEDLSSPAKK